MSKKDRVRCATCDYKVDADNGYLCKVGSWAVARQGEECNLYESDKKEEAADVQSGKRKC